MKVDWDKIISENYKPSKMVGGYGISNFMIDFADITGLSMLTHPIQRPHPDDLTLPNPDFLPYDLRGIPTKEEREQGLLEARMRRDEQWLLGEIPKELKQQAEEVRLTRDSHNRLLLLRNEQNRKAEAARLLARNKAISAQSAARLQAAQKGTANIQDYLARVQAVAAASAATRAQNLQSLHALATQKAAASAAEAQQQRAINANSAQILAQQNAEVARLRAEAMAKQAQIAKAPVATAPVARKAKAPQVKFGGLRYY
jgi:hypothetical protein